MSQEHIFVRRSALKAMTHIMATEDIRYYLNGVLVEATDKHTTLVATDGHKMLIIREQAENETKQPIAMIMPGDIVHALVKGRINRGLRSMKTLRDIKIEKRSETHWSAQLLSIGLDTNIEFKPIEGNFPNWRKVVPEKSSGEAGHYNPGYLRSFDLAIRDLNGQSLSRPGSMILSQNGKKNAAIIRSEIHDGVIGIIMPVTVCSDILQPQEWVAEAPPKQLENYYTKK